MKTTKQTLENMEITFEHVPESNYECTMSKDTSDMDELVGGKLVLMIFLALSLNALDVEADKYIISWNIGLSLLYFISLTFSYYYHFEQCSIINMMWNMAHIYLVMRQTSMDNFDYDWLEDKMYIVTYGYLILYVVILAIDISRFIIETIIGMFGIL